MRRKIFIIALLFLLCHAAESPADTPANTPAEALSIGTPEKMQLRFDTQTGLILEILAHNEILTSSGKYMPFDIHEQKSTWDAPTYIVGHGGVSTKFEKIEKTDDSTVVVTYRVGDWFVHLKYAVDSEWSMFSQSVKIEWQGTEETKLKGFWQRHPIWKTTEGAFCFCPGHYPPHKMSLASSESARKNSGQAPLIFEQSKDLSIVFLTDYLSPISDNGGSELRSHALGAQSTLAFQIASRMPPGAMQELGTSYVWVQKNDSETALKRIHDWYVRIGAVVPADRPKEFEKSIVYSFHPGGTIGSNCKDLGGFIPAKTWAKRIAHTGATAVWIMPIEDKSIYWPRDYYKFQEGLGSGDDYRALVKQLHELGLYVMQDCVPHGGSDTYDRAKQHPEWLAYKEDGSTFNYWCFDFNWPAWREYMKNVAIFYMTQYDVDGYRVDAVGGSKTENWNPNIPYGRASFAKLQGGLNMLRSLREGVKEIKPEKGGLLAEVGNATYGAVSDATYDFAGCYSVYHDLRRLPPEQFVSNVRRWLHESQYGEIKGLLKLRHIESHDSLRSQAWYGTRPARALMALTTFIHGMPLVYQEQEVGNLEEYKRLFAVRRALPELQGGECDFEAIQTPPGVFGVLRSRDKNRAIALINFNPEPIEVRLECADAPTVVDMFQMEEVPLLEGQRVLSLEGFGYTVLALREQGASLENFTLPSLEPGELSSELPSELGETPEREFAPTERLKQIVGIHGETWTAEIDRQSGLLLTLRDAKGKKIVSDAQLTLPPEVAALGAPAELNEEGERFVFTRAFGSATLVLEYTPTPDRLNIRAQWRGEVPSNLQLLFPCPRADVWSVATAEGVLRDNIFFRKDDIDLASRHSIYWRPLDTQTLYDSLMQPIYPEGTLCAESFDTSVSFSFSARAGALPARLQWKNRCAKKRGLVAVVSLATPAFTPALQGEIAPCASFSIGSDAPPEEKTNSPQLTPVAGGWRFENDFYRLTLARNGAIVRLESKNRREKGEAAEFTPLFVNGTLYTDYGFGEKGRRYASENDVEAYSRFVQTPEGKLRLHFEGRLRDRDRFGLLHNPVHFVLEYTLDESSRIQMGMRVRTPDLSQDGSAFLSWMMGSQTLDSHHYFTKERQIAEGNHREVSHRSWESGKEGTLPDRLEFRRGGTTCVKIHDWVGSAPSNVFWDKSNFFIALCDGKISPQTPKDQTVGWTLEVVPGED
ncbi:MAG: alpha-amylase family glycosyl hydrolase [Planctomycetia bacterium]|nr:alpha-amylase family glycosyl hydrolase [Planctomycetia bacterium]